MTDYFLNRGKIEEFKVLNNKILQAVNIFERIAVNRKSAVELFKAHGHDDEAIKKLEFCVRNEIRFRDVILPSLDSTKVILNETRHYFDTQLSSTVLSKKSKEIIRAYEQASLDLIWLVNHIEHNLNSFDARLEAEQKYLRHQAVGTLHDLHKLWIEEELTLKEFKRYYPKIKRVKKNLSKHFKNNIFASTIISGATFLSLGGKPTPPEVMPDMGPVLPFLFGLSMATIALYNMIKLFGIEDMYEETKDLRAEVKLREHTGKKLKLNPT